ncbi:MAG: aspartyl protease family protein [Terriglobia bacterium]
MVALATTLTFRHSHHYGALSASGIAIPVKLTVSGKSVRLLAKLDTGADYCIFERVYGEQLGLNIESGRPTLFRTANGEFQAFGHEVTITCFDWQFDSVVFFPATIEIGRNVLGRQGWLQKFRVALIDYDSVLHLSHYNE